MYVWLKNILIIKVSTISYVSNQESKASSSSHGIPYSIRSNYVIILKIYKSWKNISKGKMQVAFLMIFPLNFFLLRKLILHDLWLMIYINLYF